MKLIRILLLLLGLVLSIPVVGLSATPTVSSVTPASGATNVAVSSTVKVKFSTSMTTSSVTTSSFYILDPAGFQVATNSPVASKTTNSNDTFTITPTVSLAPCTTYTAVISTAVKSSTGTYLASKYQWSFNIVSSATAPTVVSTVPASGATGVVESVPVTVTFSTLMNPTTINTTVFGLDNGATGTVTTANANGVTTATFTPSPNLLTQTTYTATMGTGAQNYCGTALASSKSWQFTTRDITAPYVTSTVPSNGAIKIAVTSPITINFSEAMQTLSSSNITVSKGGTAITGTVTFDSTSKLTATFTPTYSLDYNTLYTVTISNAKDLGGNNLAPNPTTFTFQTTAQEIVYYCNIPPFVSSQVQPNVLLIMDNSNSMDEDFQGNAVGSYATASKSVAGKKALQQIVQTYADMMRIGLMTYSLPSSSKYYISNSPYFVSYDPKSYCPYPPDECVDYCQTGSGSSKTTCHSQCQLQNSSFDETYMDEVITSRSIGDTTRNKYCGLVYPKTLQIINPSDPTRYVYYKQALPFYSSSAPGNQFNYASAYNPLNELTSTSQYTSFSYGIYSSKTGTNDTFANYSGSQGSSSFGPTDSDLAAGYGNFGRRNISLQIGPTWFANSSPGGGYLQVAVDSNDSVNTQKNLLLNKLTTYEGNSTGYMSCTSTSNPNSCSYIVNAGLTPTAGTLQTATDYFTGSSSPIQQRCQQNFIIYVTDGSPSVDASGHTGTADTLLGTDSSPASGTVLYKLDALHSISKAVNGTTYPFDVKTYVLGLGLSSDDKARLGMMASHGGTTQAYYADNSSQLYTSLDSIFLDILQKVSSGTSASIVNNRGESGSNLFQAVFYPKKIYSGINLYWVGDLQNLWYFLDPSLVSSSMREDTDYDNYLDLKADERVTVDFDVSQQKTVANWYLDTTGLGDFTLDSTRSPGEPDAIRALWRAGGLLHYRSSDSRIIKTAILNGVNKKYLDSAAPSDGLTNFTTANDASLYSLLNITDATSADPVIQYIRGVDSGSYRNRTVTITYPSTAPAPLNTTISGVWKLGDIVSSTPQAETSKQLNSYDSAYNDSTYSNYYTSTLYANRNMIYTAANDGMLHAFRSGQVTRVPYDVSNPNRVAKITDQDSNLYIGDEEWAFVPQNALPYLKYLADTAYNHIYYVNNTVTLLDASINAPTSDTSSGCNQATYWECSKKTNVNTTTNVLNPSDTSWRTLLIGGMGLGGASRDANGFCNNNDGTTPIDSAHETRFDCVKTPTSGQGLSSFFALDVTNPHLDFTNPSAPATNWQYLWEFSDAILAAADRGLGFATAGPAIVKMTTRYVDSGATRNYSTSRGKPDLNKNSRWFAVFATGPSGPIDTINHQFLGKSDNELKVYVVDIHPDLKNGWVKGTNYWVFPSGIKNAFAGDITDAVVDTDHWNSSANGYFSDDVVYIGYTRPTDYPVVSTSTWTKGGVLRLLTNNSTNPAEWSLSTVIDGIGPVTTAVTKLQDRKNGKLWLYFGTGRYYWKTSAGSDDPDDLQQIIGITESCYDGTQNKMNAGFADDTVNTSLKAGCNLTPPAVLSLSDLQDQSTSISTRVVNGVTQLPAGKVGWYIQLDPSGSYAMGTNMTTSDYTAERVITNTTAAFNGLVTFTTTKPTNDVCSYGGATLVWLVDYATGGVPPASTLKGKILIQLSGGQLQSIDMSTATNSGGDATQKTRLDRRLKASLAGQGFSGLRGGNQQTLTKPVRKILHIMER